MDGRPPSRNARRLISLSLKFPSSSRSLASTASIISWPTDSLDCLDVLKNKLSCQLTSYIRQLTIFLFLDVDENSHIGVIPSYIERMTGLNELYFELNDFYCCISSEPGIPTELSKLINTNEQIFLEQHKPKARFLWTIWEFFLAFFLFINKFGIK